MKKYVKPELFYERFELSQHIADCQWEFNGLNTKEACAAYPEAGGYVDGILFVDKEPCQPGVVEVYCYQPGNDGLPKVVIS